MHNKYKFSSKILAAVILFALAISFNFADAKKNKAAKIPKPKGTWHVVAIYSGHGPNGPFTPNTAWNVDDYGFDITFKKKGFCTTHWKDATDETNTKPHCEGSLTYNKDGTFTGDKDGRLKAFGGFMRLSGSQLEFIEGGMGYTKFVLKKK